MQHVSKKVLNTGGFPKTKKSDTVPSRAFFPLSAKSVSSKVFLTLFFESNKPSNLGFPTVFHTLFSFFKADVLHSAAF